MTERFKWLKRLHPKAEVVGPAATHLFVDDETSDFVRYPCKQCGGANQACPRCGGTGMFLAPKSYVEMAPNAYPPRPPRMGDW